MSIIAKKHLFSEALKLFFAYGVKSVSMDDLARLMGISKKTIYTFIDNKSDLVNEVVRRYIKAEEKKAVEISKNSINAIDEIITIARNVQKTLLEMKPTLVYDLKKYYPKTWKLVEDQHFKFIEAFITKNLQRGIEEGYFRENLKVDIIPSMYMAQARLTADYHLLNHSERTQAEVHEAAILYHLHGILNAHGIKELNKYLKNETI